MRLLVTGAPGFVGAHLARAALEAGVEVVAVHRAGSDMARLDALAPEARRVECDLFDAAAVAQMARDVAPDACVHLAWYAKPGAYLHADDNVQWVSASAQLMLALKDAGCIRFVGAGTCAEYDASAAPLTERSPLAPTTVYAASKVATQELLAGIAKRDSLSFAWARLFLMYGPFESRGRLVSDTAVKLIAGEVAKTSPGTQVRDFSHVEDTARALLALAQSDLVGPVNVASGQGVAVREVVAELAQAAGPDAQIDDTAYAMRADEVMVQNANISKLRALSLPGVIPRWSLQEGIANTLQYWRNEAAR